MVCCLLYAICTRTLAIGHGIAARVRKDAKLHLAVSCIPINFMDFELLASFLATIMVAHFPLFALILIAWLSVCISI